MTPVDPGYAEYMRRRALRPSFVVTFALGAAAIAGGCGKDSGAGPDGGGISSGSNPPAPSPGCPTNVPTEGELCSLPSSTSCTYGPCADAPNQSAVCQQGRWSLLFPGGCNPPVVYEAGPDVVDAAPDVSDAGSDGEGQDGGHD